MAHNATLCRVPFDSRHLFETDDRDYVVWLSAVVDKVRDTQEAP